ncbi:MAG: hypothetical protein R3C53_08170 [Pirellulaceae bacterium]
MDASNVEIEPRSSTGVSFELGEVSEGQLKLSIDADDDLQSDNEAYAGLDPPRQLEVLLVTDGNAALEAATATEPAQRSRRYAVWIRPHCRAPNTLNSLTPVRST